MFRQSLDRLAPDDVLAKTVFDGHGRPLLKAGTPLEQHYVDALRARGILTVFVQDGLVDDLPPTDVISEHVRAKITGHVASTYAAVARVGAERGVASGDVEATADRLGEQPLDLGRDGAELIAQLHDDVETLISELLESESLAGLESLKTHNEYTFQHSVDVAVVGVLIGKHLGMPRDRLHHLALGCLLHDIGKSYIDAAILDKPGKLNLEERRLVEEHPRMGFELCRRLPVGSILPAHVAFQHHERQDGRGYPRGLVGDNHVGPRLDAEQLGERRMLLIAEIAGVADVYSALSSDRPYRAAMAPDLVIDTLEDMGTSHLNREVLRRLQRIIPRYPVGHWVELTSGPRAGSRGVVCRVTPRTLHQPVVRLVLDEKLEALDSPIEIDTSVDEVDLRCLEWNDDPATH